MGFSLMGFLGGAAERGMQRIAEEERKLEEKLKYERQVAMRQRAARRAKREKEEAYAKEMLGTLTMLGYDEDTAASILAKGKGAVKIGIDAGQQALTKGMDVNTLWNFSSKPDDDGDIYAVSDTINAASAMETSTMQFPVSMESTTGVGYGDLTKTTKSTAMTFDDETIESAPVKVTSKGAGPVLNKDVYAKLYGTPDKVETSLSARLAVVYQKQYSEKDPNKAAAYDEEINMLLDAMRKEAEAKREPKAEKEAKVPTSFQEALTSIAIQQQTEDDPEKLEALEKQRQSLLQQKADFEAAGRAETADKTPSSYQQILAGITDQLRTEKDPDKIAALNAEKEQVLADYQAFQDKGRAPEKPTKSATQFTLPAITGAVKSELTSAFNVVGFKSLDGQILESTEGKKGQEGTAYIIAAKRLHEVYSDFNDPAMTNQVKSLRSQGINTLVNHGKSTVFNAKGKPGGYYKGEVENANVVVENMRKGMYNVGDVITVKTKKGIKIIVYTGVNDIETNNPFILMDY